MHDLDVLAGYTADIKLTDEQSRNIELVDLIDEYLQISERLGKGLSTGMLDVKRANYVSTSQNMRFGPDYWDHRIGLASKVVEIEGTDAHLIDRTPKKETKKKKPAAAETSEKSTSAEKSETTAENRKEKHRKEKKPKEQNAKQELQEETDEVPVVKDPLSMFGLPPKPLRDGKGEFDKVVEDAVRLANIEAKIAALTIKPKADNGGE